MCHSVVASHGYNRIVFILGIALAWVGAAVADPVAAGGFVPWDALIDDPDLGPTWQLSNRCMYSINGGAYPLAFGLARDDGGPRGMNALQFRVDGNDIGHHETAAQEGFFDVINSGDTNIFTDLLLMVAVDANQLDGSFGLTIGIDGSADPCGLDPQTDFVYYDPCALGYDTGRPSGLYWNTIPSYEPTTYLFNRGMVSVYALEKVNLAPGGSTRIYYDFNGLDCRAVFNVYASVQKKDKATGTTVTQVYHTNRAVANPDEPGADVSTFAVVPPCWVLDLDGNGRVGMADLKVIFGHIGWAVADTTDPVLRRADVDGNGVIDWPDVEAFVDMVVTYCADR